MESEFNMASQDAMQSIDPENGLPIHAGVKENYVMEHITFEDVRGILSLVEIALTRGALKGDEIATVNQIRQDCVAEVEGYQQWVQLRQDFLQKSAIRAEEIRLQNEQNLREQQKAETEARLSQQILMRKELENELNELKKQYNVTGEQPVQQEPVAPVETKPSAAFTLARAMNPQAEENSWTEPMVESNYIPTDIPQSEVSSTIQTSVSDSQMEQAWNELDDDTAESEGKDIYSGRITSSTQPIISGGNAPSVSEPISTDEDFNARVEETKQAFDEHDDSVTPIAQGVYLKEVEVDDDTITEPSLDIGYENPTVGEDDVVLKQSDIKVFEEQPEEEYDEVVIPSSSELKSMTKSRISDAAKSLQFENITGTKAEMISKFEEQSTKLIEELTGSDGFIDASETDVSNDDDRRNGGYF